MTWAVADEPSPKQPAGWVASLLEERRGYVLRGLADRVAQIDAEIARFGLAVEDEVTSVETTEAAPDAELEVPEVKSARSRKG